MTVYEGYYDTSGTESDNEIIVTVGAVATHEKWAKHELRWNAVLKAFGVSSFHMRKLGACEGEYSTPEWRDTARQDAFIGALIKEAKRGVNKWFVSAVDLADYKRLNAKYRVTETIGGAYSLAQATCIANTVDWLGEKKKPTDAMAFFIEAGDAGQSAFLKFLRQDIGGELAIHCIPKSDSLGTSRVQFQASDLVAYEHRRLYAKIATTRLWPAPETWRRSLIEIKRTLPIDTGIHHGDSLRRLCEDGTFPLRSM
jgi:hypothetical protein